MRFPQFIAIAWLIIVGALNPADAEVRVALVIGNGAYKSVPALKNPPNDARDLAEALRKLDFDVDLGVNLQLGDMQRKVTAFARRAQTADVALAFFAGHGVQAPDQRGSAQAMNYLLPIDADIRDEADLGFLITARDILARLQGARSVRILILDACRDNAVPRRLAKDRGVPVPRGLGPEPKTSGTLIAYSTQPDTTADDGADRNSPFVKALLDRIAEPSLDIRLLFADVRSDVISRTGGAQTPETSDSLNGRFALKSAPETAVPPPALPLAPVAAAEAAPPAQQAPAGQQQTAVAAPPFAPAMAAADPCGGPVTASSLSPCTAPLTAAQERGLKASDTFRECENCPEMVVVPAGAFTMGSPETEQGRWNDEGPQHVVTLGKAFAVGKWHVTVDQFAAFVQETGYAGTKCYKWPSLNRDGSWRDPGFAQDGSHPVVCVRWADAQAYAGWMAKKTGKPYRLLSEAEFEYAARGRTSPGAYPRFWFGNDEREFCQNGNGADQKARDSIAAAKTWTVAPCNDGYAYTSPAGHYAPNAFGLYDMAGNAWQWTADCYHDSYNGAPADGSAWISGACNNAHVARGGSWDDNPRSLRAAHRGSSTDGNDFVGFRLARTLTP